SSQSKQVLNTYVLAASFTNMTIRDLSEPVTITLQHLIPKEHDDGVQCVFWDFKQNDGLGGWNPSGCEMTDTSRNSTTCQCNHLTHFGVLLDISRTALDPLNDYVLTIITYIGCGISSIFLGVSLLTYLVFEKLRRDNPSKILINLCTALLMLNLVFLLNSWLASFNNYGLCISVAIFLHYFLLASFTWMGLEAMHMYFALVKVFNIYIPNYILKLCIAGWGIPAVVVAIVVSVNMDFYGSEFSAKNPFDISSDSFCWIKNDIAFYISVVVYVCLIFFANIAVFFVVLVQIHNMKAKKHKALTTGFLQDLKSIISLSFLLGLTWGLAFFAWGSVKVPFMYLFSVFNTLQGFFIFVFHCFMKENVQKQWRIHLCCGSFRLNEYTDWSRSGTNARSNLKSIDQKSSVHSIKSTKSNSTNSTSNSSASGQNIFPKTSLENDYAYDNVCSASSTFMPTIPDSREWSHMDVETYCKQLSTSTVRSDFH
uniref:Adhesion G protein-coupled receptor G4b n=1 Tax=Latimeria chalumnae TaxID=7897 RepID=H3B957_LATCH